MQDSHSASPALGQLYAELAPQLLRIVSSNLTAPEGVIEDACQMAWGSFLQARASIARGAELGWLVTTATRQALRQLRFLRNEVSYEEQREQSDLDARASLVPGPARTAELRERLAEIHQLPVRQQRMLWMHGVGYDYGEIAVLTGDSRRTVERQLLRAKRRLGTPA